MKGRIRLYDYRCFRRESPGVIEIDRGFTALVGANNSGKTTLMRSLYELRNVFQDVFNRFDSNPLEICTGKLTFYPLSPSADIDAVLNDRSDPELRIDLEVFPEGSATDYVSRIILALDRKRRAFSISTYLSNENLFDPKPLNLQFSHKDDELGVFHLENGTPFVSYAEIQAFLSLLSNARYFGPFRNAINQGTGQYFDLSVGTAFIEEWNQWKTGANTNHNRKAIQVTRDVSRLMSVTQLEINASADKSTLQISVDNRPYKLFDIGSGISQLIIILGNVAISQPSLILIDEPETNLHPALQAEFLETLASYAQDGVIFTTHSIGLARQIADRVYAVYREHGRDGSAVREFGKVKHYAEFLGSLGVAGLQDIGWNKILLVEGVTDVRVFQQFLRLYDKDREVVVIPMGGDGLSTGNAQAELAEIKRLCPSVYAIVDSEKSAQDQQPEKRRRDFKEICDELDIQCCVTERRATENYFTQRAINQVFPDKYEELPPYSSPNKPHFWGKTDNWRVAKAMTREELDGTDIGTFLSAMN